MARPSWGKPSRPTRLLLYTCLLVALGCTHFFFFSSHLPSLQGSHAALQGVQQSLPYKLAHIGDKHKAGALTPDQQRYMSSFPDGRLALCTVVKDEQRDLREWVEYHAWIGVRKIYLYDNNSSAPLLPLLQDYARKGLVEYNFFLGMRRRRKDWRLSTLGWAQRDCILRFRPRHHFLAFLDADEFLVIAADVATAQLRSARRSLESALAGQQHLLRQAQIQRQTWGRPWTWDWPWGRAAARHRLQAQAVEARLRSAREEVNRLEAAAAVAAAAGRPAPPDINLFLDKYGSYGGLALPTRVFGSSGREEPAAGGVLGGYTKCLPTSHPMSRRVKVVANTYHVLDAGEAPGVVELLYPDAVKIVDERRRAVSGFVMEDFPNATLTVHHYVLKSRQQFEEKLQRGSPLGDPPDQGLWDVVEAAASDTCSTALAYAQHCCPSTRSAYALTALAAEQ